MSLNIYLQSEPKKVKRKITGLIYEVDGENETMYDYDFDYHNISEQLGCLFFEENYIETFYSANITHNLNTMAEKAGIYDVLWRPYRLHKDYKDFGKDYEKEMKFEESVTIRAKEITQILENGLKSLVARPEHFKQFNSSNGWGMYEHFVPFVRGVLNACKEYPESIVKSGR